MGVELSGWSRRLLADGFMLYPPGGRAQGGVRVQDRVRPLRSFRTLVEQAIAASAPLLEPPAIGPLVRLVTVEGEHAAAVTLAARRRADGQPIERTLGMVVAEDGFTRVDGVIQEPAEFAGFRDRVLDVVRHVSLGLGWQRRRWYGYAPPPGWQATARTFSAEWYPLAYPRDDATISVFHAKPLRAGGAARFDRALREDLGAGFVVEGQDAPAPAANDHGLDGEIERTRGAYPGAARRHVDLAVLADARFLYLVRLDSGDGGRLAEHRRAFEALVRSVAPVPVPGAESDDAPVGHWAT